MADLSREALQFLQTHLNFDQRSYLTKKKLRSEMEKFWRRREKALEEFKVLPPDHPRKAEFETAIRTATGVAENGDLKGAYRALDAVKLAARAEANVVRNGVDINTVLADLAPMETKARGVAAIVDSGYDDINDQASRLELFASMIAPATGAASHEEAVQLAGDALAARTEFRDKVATLKTKTDQYKTDYIAEFNAAPNTKTTMARLEHNLGLLRAEGKVPGNIEGRFLALANQVIVLGMEKSSSDFTNKLSDRMTECATDVEKSCALALKLPEMDLIRSTDDDGNRLDSEAETASLGTKFAELEKQNEARIEAARERMKAEANWDYYLERNPVEPSLVAPSRVDFFDTSDVLGVTDLGFDPFDRSVDNDTFATAAADRLETLLTASIAGYENADPEDRVKVPDQLLEVASRTYEGWCEEVAKTYGLVWDPNTLSPPFRDKIEAGAKALQQKAQDIYPDKAAPDMSSFTMGGVLFDDVKFLGQGGGGKVYLAKSADGRQVVIKSPNSAENANDTESKDGAIDEMRTEILAQRAVTGGENGQCSDNLLEHHGMVLSSEGIPLPVMDLADAGDASEFNNAMSSLSGSGIISESARQAMVAVQMRDVLKGVKAMHDQGYAHFDLKELNVFVTKDGTFKVADFGLAQTADTRDEKLEDQFESTEIYQSPEITGMADLSMKGDLFSLGAMMQRAQSTTNEQHIDAEGFGSRRPGASARKEMDGKDIDVSASTRLISKLMSENPDDRPSIETVLEASYFREIEEGHTPEQIARLRKAAAEYAATVGRKTKKLEEDQAAAQAKVAYSLRQLTKESTRDLIKAAELFIKRAPGEIERLEMALAAETRPEKRVTIETRLSSKRRSLESMEKALLKHKADLEVPLSDRDIKKARDELEHNQARVKALAEEIRVIREDPQYADVMAELKEADAPFR